jgi:hypothetical protein
MPYEWLTLDQLRRKIFASKIEFVRHSDLNIKAKPTPGIDTYGAITNIVPL